MNKIIAFIFCLAALNSFAQTSIIKEDSVLTFREKQRAVYISEDGKEIEEGDAFADSIINWIFKEAVNSKNLEFYDSSFRNKISNDDVKSILSKTIVVNKNFDEIKKDIPISPKDIIGINYFESIAYNKQKNELKKTIHMLGPVVNSYKEDGSILGKKILFMIKMN